MLEHRPILAVSGWSGSGKTTLLVQALSHLAARGLSVAVVKHDAHGLDARPAEKDGNRLFRRHPFSAVGWGSGVRGGPLRGRWHAARPRAPGTRFGLARR
ncbi:MAG: molybdopterin-guanine dinucleotide biosynthesis protein MobB [Pirellulales bacterium]